MTRYTESSRARRKGVRYLQLPRLTAGLLPHSGRSTVRGEVTRLICNLQFAIRNLQFLLLAVLAALSTVLPCRAAASPHERQRTVLLDNALAFLRTQQNEDGSFGAVQPHLQTAVATLAFLSVESPPQGDDGRQIERAVAYLEKTSGPSGDLGDDLFRTESHAISATALMSGLEHVRDQELRARAAKKLYRAVRLLQQLQDRSSSSSSRGGWKMEGRKGSRNDRRASAWALLCYLAARKYGIEVRPANLERGVRFMVGAFKRQAKETDQIGGFSVDTEGLAVASISSMGGWVLARFDGREEDVRLNLAWLARHPIEWSGPNYFYTNFFRIRALKFSDPRGDQYRRAIQRLFTQIKDHQLPNGSVSLPPGNAQNTVAMGPVFSTAMSVLIVNAEHSRLVFDEDYRLRPRF